MEGIHLALIGRHHAHLIQFHHLAAGHQQHLVALANRAGDHAEIHDHAPVGVVVGVEYQGPQRLGHFVGGSRHPIHHGLEDFGNSQASFCRAMDGIGAVEPNDCLNFIGDAICISAGQINLVENRNDLKIILKGQVYVCQGLSFHALAGIHHQQGAFTSLQ